MNTKYRHLTLALAMVGLTTSGSLIAQEQFPTPNDRPASCDGVDWHKDMLDQYPKVIAACEEVVIADDGSKWARFASNFVRQESDDSLIFSIQGPNDRRIQEVTVTPSIGQVAYIEGRETEFKDLNNGQPLNLYMAEGSSGFTTEVGVMPNETVSTRSTTEYGSTDSDEVDAGNSTAAVQYTDSKQLEQEDSKQLQTKVGALDNVQFTLNSDELTPAAKLILDEHARKFTSNSNVKYLIAGHASASASQEYNQDLSERRAKSVMNYLINERNVDSNHLSMVGYGEMRPIAREATDGASNSKEAQANMRVGFETA